MLNLGENHDFPGFRAIKEVISNLDTQKFQNMKKILLDPKFEIRHILKFLGVKVAYDLFYGPKTMKIVIFP